MWHSLILVLIILSHSVLVLFPLQPAALAQEEVESYADSLIQSLTQKGIPTTPEEAGILIDRADGLSEELFGDNATRRSTFMGQLFHIYVQAAGEDVVIIATPGGWGVDPVTEGGQWLGVTNGMRSTLEDWGYTPVIVDYLRMTSRSDLSAYPLEILGIIRFFAVTARELSAIVEFIIQDNPQIEIIITGLSHGGAYTDAVMKHLQSKPQVIEQVIGIEGGPPFYQVCRSSDRTLVLTSNGIVPDNWSQGNRWIIVSKAVIGTFEWLIDRFPWIANEERKQEKHDRHAYYIQTPGHEYAWDGYPELSSQIIDFLHRHFCEES